jgi:hypothetical protein
MVRSLDIYTLYHFLHIHGLKRRNIGDRKRKVRFVKTYKETIHI